MIIDCIADLHGNYPKLEGGDLLIIAGDLTARHTDKEWHEFASWMHEQNYIKIVFIAGNHDTMIEKWDKEQDAEGYQGPVSDSNDRIEYLCDSGTEFEGLKIWGSPWTKTFEGMNPHCKAFTCDTEEELASKFSLIPDDTDILITHSPPYGIYDAVRDYPQDIPQSTGSQYLMDKIRGNTRLKLHIFGHIHEHGGKSGFVGPIKFINGSYVNEYYQPVNKPIRVIL